jgi:hypothetical protein
LWSTADAIGVGHNKHPVPYLGGANGLSRYAVPPCIIPERGQLSEYNVQPSIKQRWDVFHDDESRSKLANDAGKFEP